MPIIFSSSQRIRRLRIAQLARELKVEPQAASRSRRAMHQSDKLQAVVGHVLGLGLQHQLRNVDGGRALQAALVAVDAQVGDRFQLFGLQAAGIEPAGQHGPQQIRLGPRRRFFARGEAKDRAHPLFGALRPAAPAAVAGPRGAGDVFPVPRQFQLDERPWRRRGSPASPLAAACATAGGWLGISGRRFVVSGCGNSATTLPGFSKLLRVENAFDLAKHLVQRPGLPAQEPAAAESQARARR